MRYNLIKQKQMELTQQQQTVLKNMTDFLQDKEKSVFILRGYAGTGKTTMIKNLIPVLQSLKKNFILLAPTGRAAKVLKEKTGYPTSTIHRCIYSFDRMYVARHDEDGKVIKTNINEKFFDKLSDGDDRLHFFFGLNEQDEKGEFENLVLVVDEASMVSSKEVRGELLTFGTGVILDDLLTYLQPRKGGKVIFIGDPVQLPPVGDNCSAALTEDYFIEKGLAVESAELTEVLRQNGESAILKNAMLIRDLWHTQSRNSLNFICQKGEVEDITPESVVKSFVQLVPYPEIGRSIVICYTNAQTRDYNESIRRRYFPGHSDVAAGDVLQIVHNNINNNLGYSFFNGDFVRVLEVGDGLEEQSAPVWTSRYGKRTKVVISLKFRDVVLLTETGEQVKCKIIDNLLNANNREQNHKESSGLSYEESVALYINFRIRHSDLRNDEEAFKEALMQDPYFNAVQAKYGYAITCHKAQGGEWDTVFVDYSKRNGLDKDSLQWSYTATTRASKKLYGVSMPHITPISSIKCNPITAISKLPKEAFSYKETEAIPLLGPQAKEFQKQKYSCLKELLEPEGFTIQSVKPLPYNDRYTLKGPDGELMVDCIYNGAGMYTQYKFLSKSPENEMLLPLFENEEGFSYSYHYEPSCEAFRVLNAYMVSLCDELGIQIANIVEYIKDWYIGYFLKTAKSYALIRFYFNKDRSITYANPQCYGAASDEELQQIIDNLQQTCALCQ